MKTSTLLTLLCTLICTSSFSQKSYTKQVDKIACNIEKSKTKTIKQGEVFKDADSVVTGFRSVHYKYKNDAEDLVRVNEMILTPVDSTIVDYYFDKQKLIKVEYNTKRKSGQKAQSFYYKEQRQVGVSPKSLNLDIQPSVFIANANEYLKLKIRKG
jgi:hypothetical protein